TAAMEQFRVDMVMNDLKSKGVVLGKLGKQDVPEECRFAYKDIDEVMEQQKDLVEPVKRLFCAGVVKG
ncbi:MAG: RtcB family protein, partial [Oscillospiraceae bacterium]|nr:RtcB family protein [Oscillospiraceae bacterium]